MADCDPVSGRVRRVTREGTARDDRRGRGLLRRGIDVPWCQSCDVAACVLQHQIKLCERLSHPRLPIVGVMGETSIVDCLDRPKEVEGLCKERLRLLGQLHHAVGMAGQWPVEMSVGRPLMTTGNPLLFPPQLGSQGGLRGSDIEI